MIRKIWDVFEDFVRAYFDKLLLTVLFVFLTSIIVQFPETPTGTWAQQAAGTILGALVMLTTGRAISKNGKPPEDPAK